MSTIIEENMQKMLPEGLTEEMLQFAVLFYIGGIVLRLVFAHAIYAALKLVRKENRCILPSQVWFVAMPLFNIYWNFEVVKRMRDSLNNEFYDRQIAAEENPTQRYGRVFAWTFLLVNIPLPTVLLLPVGMLHIAYFIAYWLSIHGHKRLLEHHIRHFGKDGGPNNEPNESTQ